MSADRFRLAVVLLLAAAVLVLWGTRATPSASAQSPSERYQLIQVVDDELVMAASTRIFEPGTGKLYLWLPGDDRGKVAPHLVILDPVRASRVTRPVTLSDQRSGR